MADMKVVEEKVGHLNSLTIMLYLDTTIMALGDACLDMGSI